MSNRPKLQRSKVPGYTQKSQADGGFPWAIVAIVAVVIVVAAAIAIGTAGGDDDDGAGSAGNSELLSEAYGGKATSEFRSVDVSGEALPQLADTADDPAVGMAAPKLEGANFVDDPAAVGDGPAMIVFGAHWCHVCQSEVPQVSQWLNDGLLPEGVDATLVSTATEEGTGEDPPSLWVASTGWDEPVLVDSDSKEAATAYGLSAFPFFVFVDSDNNVVRRASGALPREQVEQYLSEIAPSSK